MFYLVVFLILIGLVGVLLVVAFTRKGSVATVAMTKRRITLHSETPPDVVYTRLTQSCPTGYTIEDADPAQGIVILSSRPTSVTWGFFYPAAIHAEGTGSRIELGISSKLLQYGPLVTRAHQKLAHALAQLSHSRIDAD